MGRQGQEQQGQEQGSLAAFLGRLRPGSQCACCRGRLEVDRGKGRTVLRRSSTNAEGSLALLCPVCGCEIAEEAGLEGSDSPECLSSAA